MKIEGANNKIVMLFEIEDGETFTCLRDTCDVFIKTTGRETHPSLTDWYTCVSLKTGKLFSFSEAEEVVKCKAKVVVE